MIFEYNGVNVYFQYYNGISSNPIIFLHGWGRSGKDFENIINLFQNHSCLAIDFPPFGKSKTQLVGWNLFTYAGMLMSLFEHLNIEKAHFVGHSFGGRLLLILAAVKRTLVQSCIFIDSAGMKPRFSLKKKIKVLKYKFCRKFNLKTAYLGSDDYKVLSPEMKETFKSVVNTPLEDYAKKVNTKTLIIWGENDTTTPLYMAKRLKKLIKNSELKILKNAGHFSFLDCPLETYYLMEEFYKEK